MDKVSVNLEDNFKAIALGKVDGVTEEDLKKAGEYIISTIKDIQEKFPEDTVRGIVSSMAYYFLGKELDKGNVTTVFATMEQMELQTRLFKQQTLMMLSKLMRENKIKNEDKDNVIRYVSRELLSKSGDGLMSSVIGQMGDCDCPDCKPDNWKGSDGKSPGVN